MMLVGTLILKEGTARCDTLGVKVVVNIHHKTLENEPASSLKSTRRLKHEGSSGKSSVYVLAGILRGELRGVSRVLTLLLCYVHA